MGSTTAAWGQPRRRAVRLPTRVSRRGTVPVHPRHRSPAQKIRYSHRGYGGPGGSTSLGGARLGAMAPPPRALVHPHRVRSLRVLRGEVAFQLALPAAHVPLRHGLHHAPQLLRVVADVGHHVILHCPLLQLNLLVRHVLPEQHTQPAAEVIVRAGVHGYLGQRREDDLLRGRGGRLEVLEEQLGVSKRGLGRAELVWPTREKVRGESDELSPRTSSASASPAPPSRRERAGRGRSSPREPPCATVVGDEIASLLHEF